VDGVVPLEGEAKNTGELVRLPFVWDWPLLGGFARFSLERHFRSDTHLLMAEFDNGQKWFVVAYLQGPEEELGNFNILPGFDASSKRADG
jgi:hypothetical protein